MGITASPAASASRKLCKTFAGRSAAPPGVGGEPAPARDVVYRVEAANRPLVGQHSGEAHHAVQPARREGVRQGRGADEFQGDVDTVGHDVAHSAGYPAVVDDDTVDAD